MSQKVVRVHIKREPEFLYYVRGNSIYRAPMEAQANSALAQAEAGEEDDGEPRGGEHLRSYEFAPDPCYFYFLDAEGDISRARRTTTLPARRGTAVGTPMPPPVPILDTDTKTAGPSRLSKTPGDKVLGDWKNSIKENGVKKIKRSQLLAAFGYMKRTDIAVAAIITWLEARDIFLYKEGLREGNLDEYLTLIPYKQTQIGKLFERESDLCEHFEDKVMPKLGLHTPQQGYSPKHTQDRFDFLCQDYEGRHVVVELKRADGEKHAVEQVMRYLGHLHHAGGHQAPWGILITGYADPYTRRALLGRDRDTHIRWYLYGLSDDRQEILVEEVKLP